MCPICNSPLSNSDSKEFRLIVSFLGKYVNPDPVHFLWSMAKDMARAGRIIYYDFTNLPQVERYFYCDKCHNYFLECPKCVEMVHMGTESFLHPVKRTCPNCKTNFVYNVHQDPDDVVDHSQFL